MIVSPEIDAVTPPSTWNTRLSPPPLTVTPAFGPVIVSVPVVSVSSSWVPVRVIVCGVLNTLLSKAIVSAPPAEFAWPTAQRRVPALPLSSVLVTVNVDSSRAVLERQHRRLHPPPLPGLDRPRPPLR